MHRSEGGARAYKESATAPATRGHVLGYYLRPVGRLFKFTHAVTSPEGIWSIVVRMGRWHYTSSPFWVARIQERYSITFISRSTVKRSNTACQHERLEGRDGGSPWFTSPISGYQSSISHRFQGPLPTPVGALTISSISNIISKRVYVSSSLWPTPS